MLSATIVVDRLQDCPCPLDGHRVITVNDYAKNPRAVPSGTAVVNLCRTGYLSHGYYCSLIAEARGQSVLPSVATLGSIQMRSLHGPAIDRLNRALTILLEEDPTVINGRASLVVCFGQTAEPNLQRLAALVFEIFPCPLLMIDFDSRSRRVTGIRQGRGRSAPAMTGNLFRDFMERWLSGRQGKAPPAGGRRRLAILHDPADPLPPSKPTALDCFRRAGDELGLDVALIRHRDADRLAEFDALFIRETTSVRHPSFRFAVTAAEHGMPVIDDPQSILHCGNKVFLAELLDRHGVPVPRTMVTDGGGLREAAERLGYPIVLKRPDGCSSRGVVKAETPADLERAARPLLAASRLIVAQEYLYTPFDWRVTVLAGRPLFACRYRMAEGHWQIYRHGADGRSDEGATECVALHAVPAAVVDAAVGAAALIGDGLYGVDLKDTPAGVRVIEVNDNPNIDVGLEDAILGADLYRAVLQEFARRIDARRDGIAAPVPVPSWGTFTPLARHPPSGERVFRTERPRLAGIARRRG